MNVALSSDAQTLRALPGSGGSGMDMRGLKHRLATSPMAGPLSSLRNSWKARKLVSNAELGLLFKEDQMMEAMLERMIRPDWNCLDIGAHIGSVSYRFHTLAPQGRHAIIEASPDKATLLAQRFPETPVLQVAVSDSAGEVTFYENLDQPGYSSLSDRGSRGRVQEITVPARRLDELFAETQRFDLVKIDVEGHEFAALTGGRSLLDRCRPVILFEAGAAEDADLDTGQSERLFDLLTKELGYRVFAVFDLYFDRPAISAELFRSYRTYPFMAFNYFALPAETNARPAPSAKE
ncbi:FkbM family methyltransferase [Lutimaribacter marinistellae]|uniref:FkbM family methyltransferase n=1 Tax=Lutimaribacter marinistellae TaxID=1820329 RepID=A0ABV7TCS0_9RHOB